MVERFCTLEVGLSGGFDMGAQKKVMVLSVFSQELGRDACY